MKRLFVCVLSMLLLAACASPLAKTETPQQAVAAAAQRASQLHSAKFDMTAAVNMSFPPAMASMFGQAANGGSMAVNLSGNGEAQFPDRYHATMNVKMGGFSVAAETVVANGKAYVKNPLTGKWEVSTQTGNLTDQLGQPDPLSYDQFLKNVKSVTEIQGATRLDNVSVRHFEVTPDKDKLVAAISKQKNAQAAAALKQVLDSGTMKLDVYIGKDDHLVRQMNLNLDYTIDVKQLLGALGAGNGSSAGLPAGSTIHAKATVTINYHDFNAPVTISIPTVG